MRNFVSLEYEELPVVTGGPEHAGDLLEELILDKIAGFIMDTSTVVHTVGEPLPIEVSSQRLAIGACMKVARAVVTAPDLDFGFHMDEIRPQTPVGTKLVTFHTTGEGEADVCMVPAIGPQTNRRWQYVESRVDLIEKHAAQYAAGMVDKRLFKPVGYTGRVSPGRTAVMLDWMVGHDFSTVTYPRSFNAGTYPVGPV